MLQKMSSCNILHTSQHGFHTTRTLCRLCHWSTSCSCGRNTVSSTAVWVFLAGVCLRSLFLQEVFTESLASPFFQLMVRAHPPFTVHATPYKGHPHALFPSTTLRRVGDKTPPLLLPLRGRGGRNEPQLRAPRPQSSCHTPAICCLISSSRRDHFPV